MDKIKSFFKRKSIKIAFAVYMLTCIVVSVILALVISNACRFGQIQLNKKYQSEFDATGSKVELEFGETVNVDKDGGTINYYVEDVTSYFTPLEIVEYSILGYLSIGVYPICFILCISITSLLFYKKQLQKPLNILDKAADNIAENNLDFEIVYNKQDELGKLCTSFEKMRLALQENNIEMWRQVEERKRLNAAFSHDLRTPLTVLKGQSEMLTKYAPQMSAEKIASTAVMMQRHITRLEEYVNTMNDLQSLEDIEINKQFVNPSDVIEQINITGKSICNGKGFMFSDNIADTNKIRLDFGIVMRVYENLLSNAIRFAKERVSVSVSIQKDCFQIIVSDDGKGFSNKDLVDATKPFYKAVKETDNEHFGMGLNICKILCEKHGGYLKLSNNNGAVVKAVFDCK